MTVVENYNRPKHSIVFATADSKSFGRHKHVIIIATPTPYTRLFVDNPQTVIACIITTCDFDNITDMHLNSVFVYHVIHPF